MTKQEFAKLISVTNKVAIDDVINVIDTIGDVLPNVLKNGESVFIRGLGTFNPTVRKAKVGRNITKNESIYIPEKIVPSLKFSEKFKEKME